MNHYPQYSDDSTQPAQIVTGAVTMEKLRKADRSESDGADDADEDDGEFVAHVF